VAAVPGEGEGGVQEDPVQPYEVGMTSDLRGKSVVGDDLAIHHVPQGKPAEQLKNGYDYENAPGMVVPTKEHRDTPVLKGTEKAGSARNQLAKDIRDLRNNTNAPNSSLQRLIQLNKQLFPDALIKPPKIK